MHQPVIKVSGLSKQFDSITAVDGISFDVTEPSVVALLGGNGAGKTTTISMLLGLIIPSAGTVRLLGTDMIKNRHAVLPRINFSSPYVDLPKRLTVRENLIVYARLYGIRKPRARLDVLAEDLSLVDFIDRPFGQLSSGQRTRVAIAKSLLNTPEILLLDEPTASLDPDTADWVRTYLRRYQESNEATILFASHNMQEVERLCSDVLIMKAGRIVDRGPPPALIERYGRSNLEDVFLDIARNRSDGAPDHELPGAAQ